MKRKLILASLALVAATTLLLNGCKKDEDSTPPVVTVTGTVAIISLNGTAPADPGATASDDEDGTLTTTSDWSSTNPNVNQAGNYTITYSATDAAGNRGTATRTVTVRNDAYSYAGTYSVVDSSGGVAYLYSQTITTDNVVNNRLHFNKFADFANNTGIYATRRPDGNIEIPSQTALSVGSGTAPCAINDRTFASTAPSVPYGVGFKLSYSIALANSTTCIGSTTGIAYYTK